MKTYQLKRAGEVVSTTEADNIDHALDAFFPNVAVDVDLDTFTNRHLTIICDDGDELTIDERAQ
jgi:hypothetical protein